VETARRIRSEFEEELRGAVDAAALDHTREVLSTLLELAAGSEPVRERAVPVPEG
jgi:hypothetical protein